MLQRGERVSSSMLRGCGERALNSNQMGRAGVCPPLAGPARSGGKRAVRVRGNVPRLFGKPQRRGGCVMVPTREELETGDRVDPVDLWLLHGNVAKRSQWIFKNRDFCFRDKLLLQLPHADSINCCSSAWLQRGFQPPGPHLPIRIS